MREEKLLKILKDNFGHSEFRFDQKEIINSVLNGKDTLAIMPTGGGKSICYQVPAIFCDGITLVISPLISLMYDQVLNLAQNGIEACFLNSSLDAGMRRDTEEGILAGKYKMVYVSPEGLLSGGLSRFFKQVKVLN